MEYANIDIYEVSARVNNTDIDSTDSVDTDSTDSVESDTDNTDSVDTDIDSTAAAKPNNPYNKYGFDPNCESVNKLNHCPEWDGDVCKCYGFVYDESKLLSYEKMFDGAYCMN